jgi:hypothetical protein
MNRKRFSKLFLVLLAVGAILIVRQWPPRVLAYHSGSESDLAANPELSALRSFGGISVDPLAIDPELALVRSFAPSESRGLLADGARWAAIGSYYTGIGERALAADTARWVAIGSFYTGINGRALAADTARWVALGEGYAPATVALPYTDVSQFYAERMRVQAHSLPYTDVSQFYAERMRVKAGQSELAANPELMVARSFMLSAGLGEDLLALNPELSVVRSYEDLSANPELLTLGKYGSCGC